MRPCQIHKSRLSGITLGQQLPFVTSTDHICVKDLQMTRQWLPKSSDSLEMPTPYRHAWKRKVFMVMQRQNFLDMTKLSCGNSLQRYISYKCSYTKEHIDVDCKIIVSDDIPGILSTKIQSRHVSTKQYKSWISYVEGVISGWYCRCKSRQQGGGNVQPHHQCDFVSVLCQTQHANSYGRTALELIH